MNGTDELKKNALCLFTMVKGVTCGSKCSREDKQAELGIILGAKAMIEIIGLLTPSHD